MSTPLAVPRPTAMHAPAHKATAIMDHDVNDMTREQLVAEVRRLRTGIRAHRDSTRHELCWHHPELWGLLPEQTDPVPVVPTWPEFMRGCIRYRESLDQQAPDAPRTDEPYQARPARPPTSHRTFGHPSETR